MFLKAYNEWNAVSFFAFPLGVLFFIKGLATEKSGKMKESGKNEGMFHSWYKSNIKSHRLRKSLRQMLAASIVVRLLIPPLPLDRSCKFDKSIYIMFVLFKPNCTDEIILFYDKSKLETIPLNCLLINGRLLSPFLQMGVTLATFSSSGNLASKISN